MPLNHSIEISAFKGKGSYYLGTRFFVNELFFITWRLLNKAIQKEIVFLVSFVTLDF